MFRRYLSYTFSFTKPVSNGSGVSGRLFLVFACINIHSQNHFLISFLEKIARYCYNDNGAGVLVVCPLAVASALVGRGCRHFLRFSGCLSLCVVNIFPYYKMSFLPLFWAVFLCLFFLL